MSRRQGTGEGTGTARNTRQRTAITSLLSEVTDFQSAQDIHAALRERGQSVGLATVYRTLSMLSIEGQVDVLMRSDGETLYRRCSTSHHHHLVCRACGRTVEVAGPAVESWAEAVAEEQEFTEVSHTIELFGLCASCSAAGTAADD